MNKMTEQFGERIRSLVEGRQKQFTQPDDDWDSIVYFQINDDEGDVAIGNLKHVLSQHWGNRDAIVLKLAQEMSQRNAVRVALVLNFWTKPDDDSEVAPEKHPDRGEALIILLADSEDAVEWKALIERHEDSPPTLGEWACSPAPRTGGRFNTLLQVLLRHDQEAA